MKDITENFDAVIFGAHPDDAEMAMGGTMIKLVQAGYRVLSVCFTTSQKSTHGDPATRARECEAAAQIIGCTSLLLDFEDTELENNVHSREAAVRIIRSAKPKVVFAPYHTNTIADFGGVSNRDHWTCGSIVRDAVKLSRLEKVVPDLPRHLIQKLYFYMLPTNRSPTMVVDVSEVMDHTLKAIHAYESQMKIQFKNNEIERVLLSIREANGILAGVRYGEGFFSDMPLMMTPSGFFNF